MFYHLITQRFGCFVSEKNDFNLYCVRSGWSAMFKIFSFFFDNRWRSNRCVSSHAWLLPRLLNRQFSVWIFFHSEYCSIRDWLPPSFRALLCQPVWQPERIYWPAWPVRGIKLGEGKTSLLALRRQIWTKTGMGIFTLVSFAFWFCLRVKVSPTGGGSLLSCPHSWTERLIRMWMTSPVMTSWWHRYKLCSTFI